MILCRYRHSSMIVTIISLLILGFWLMKNAFVKPPNDTLLPGNSIVHIVAKDVNSSNNANIPTEIHPVRVLSHYGFGPEGYKPYATVEFDNSIIGTVLPGIVISADGNSVSVKSADGIILTYAGFSQVLVRPEQTIEKGCPIGIAYEPINVIAERNGIVFDPVAVFWPDISRFSSEADRIEKERKRLAEDIRKKMTLASRARSVIQKQGAKKFYTPEQISRFIKAAAEETKLDPKLIAAVAAAESGFDPYAVSPAGAIGIMQLMPDTAKSLGVSNPFDPVQNIRAGAKYLRCLLDKYRDLKLALAAYNAGPDAVEKYEGIPPYKETIEYVERVLSYLR